MSVSGLKNILVDRLLDELFSDKPSKSPKNKGTGTGTILCKCGSTTDDNHPLVECRSCKKWSHLKCYGLTSLQVKDKRFTCSVCDDKDKGSDYSDVRKEIDALKNSLLDI